MIGPIHTAKNYSFPALATRTAGGNELKGGTDSYAPDWRDTLADIKGQLEARVALGLDSGSNAHNAALAEKILADETPTEDLKTIADRVMADASLRLEAGPKILEQVGKVEGPAKPDHAGVVDLRRLPMVSVDNGDLNPATGKLENDSKDIDQLAYAEKLPNGDIKVMVAIADVDSLVPKGSWVDQHAMHNATTIYTDDKIYPMIPERFSTDFTSLNDQEDRMAVVKEYVVSPEGEMKEGKVYQAFVHNHAKMAYDSVNEWIVDGDGPKAPQLENETFAEQIRLQDEAATRLKGFFYGLGSLDLESGEARAIMDGDKVVELKKNVQTRSKDLVKFLMIGSNATTVNFLDDNGYPSLRRIVKTPERWDRIVAYAGKFEYELPKSANAKALNDFLEVRKEADPEGFEEMCFDIVRMVGRGEYVVKTPGEPIEGHFCLALPDYGHTTAPNRRAPDLVQQRIEKAAAQGEPCPYTDEELQQLAEHFTQQEPVTNKVERRVHRSAQAKLMKDKIGQIYEGRVWKTGERGTFISLREPPVSGKLMDASGLDRGDRLQVRLDEVNVEKGWLNFKTAGEAESGFLISQ